MITLPNLLSFLRLLSTPIIVWFWDQNNLSATFFLFVASALTDLADGALARVRTNSKEISWLFKPTLTGQILDPLADRILIVTLCLVILSIFLPLWLIFIYVAMEAGLIGYSVWSQLKYQFKSTELKVLLKSNIFGKIRMAVISTTIAISIVAMKYSFLRSFVFFGFIATLVFLALATRLYVKQVKEFKGRAKF